MDLIHLIRAVVPIANVFIRATGLADPIPMEGCWPKSWNEEEFRLHATKEMELGDKMNDEMESWMSGAMNSSAFNDFDVL